MKIEKVSDNQIRCTLTKEDLVERQLKLSELAYGTEKAKSLFRDMMQQASYEFGFEAEDIPLMIEAIPVSSDCIVLLITKVEDPEELDTRFSKFAPAADDMEEIDGDSKTSSAAGLLDMFNHVKNELKEAIGKNEDTFIPLTEAISKANTTKSNKTEAQQTPPKGADVNMPKNIIKIFSFANVDTIIDVSYVLKDLYTGSNSLYKSPDDNRYYLIVNKSTHTIEDFNRVCNILLEYGTIERGALANEAYFKEHFIKIIPRKALQKLVIIKNSSLE